MNAYNLFIQKQRSYYYTGATLDIEFRKSQIIRLRDLIKSSKTEIYHALKQDLAKPDAEIHGTEYGFVLNDIQHTLEHLSSWAQPRQVPTGLTSQPGKSYVMREPLGVCLIIAPWNYPFQLALSPLVAAMAAGNTALLKPSELTSATSAVIAKLINTNFDPSYLHVAEGGVEVSTALLKEKFDKIFFTGSTAVGKIVAKAAAENLTPVTLELGGKSPAIVCSDANLEVAAKRIVWGKFLNAGQTCVAPDHILVDAKIKTQLIDQLKSALVKFYSGQFDLGENYTRIVSRRHFERLVDLLKNTNAIVGGRHDASSLKFEPTILDGIDGSHPIMQEEIFGPILPILTFDSLNAAVNDLKQKDKPLALYVFTSSKANQDLVLKNISFGGGIVNDTLMHLANHHLPFGGIGQSGQGAYHGEAGFLCFSHEKSILERATWIDPDLRYPPYSENKKKWLEKLI